MYNDSWKTGVFGYRANYLGEVWSVFMPGKYLCEVVYTEQLCDDIFALTVVSNKLAHEAQPGQFLHINCGHSRLLRRPISICGVNANAIEFVFEVKGEGTRWLSKCKPGSFLDILGPLGNGFKMPKGKVIVVGGGIGVPPLLYLADLALDGVTAVLGFRSSDRVILLDAFESVCDSVVLTTDDGSAGLCGTVTQPLDKLIRSGEYSSVFACGPHAMLKAVAQTCKQLDLPCQVSLEEKMGCGVGACLVCACATQILGKADMSRVCVEGPVFDASEIVWDYEEK